MTRGSRVRLTALTCAGLALLGLGLWLLLRDVSFCGSVVRPHLPAGADPDQCAPGRYDARDDAGLSLFAAAVVLVTAALRLRYLRAGRP